MIRFIAVLAFFFPNTVLSLSCMPHSIEATYRDAENAKESYIIVRGSLKFDAGELPKVDWNNQSATPSMTKIKGELVGKTFNGKRFANPFDQPVTLEVACFGPWCAQPSPGKDVIAFVRKDGADFFVATDPCGGFLFQNPRSEMLRALKQCHAGGQCE